MDSSLRAGFRQRLGALLLLVLAGGGGAAGLVPGLAAQDVEMLGRILGTTPPAEYFETVRADPTAFRFSREGAPRLEAIQAAAARRFPAMVLMQGGAARSIGPRPEPVVGTFRVPLVLGRYSDTPGTPPHDRDAVQREYFDGPNSYGETVSAFYQEMSRGSFTLAGESHGWVTGALTRGQVTRGVSALTSSATEGMAAWIESLVASLDAQGVDWSRYDMTGDGYVDVFAVMHPEQGAECGGADSPNRIWSHRWTVASASSGRLPLGVPTATPGPGPGGFIHVNDYTVQALRNCADDGINEIGVFAHELGHALGLPDLYSTSAVSRHAGAGQWDLMATGSWGCQGTAPQFPCGMGAWSRAMLGWVEVEEIPRETPLGTVVLPPVHSAGRVLRVPGDDGSGSYLLLENRQRLGADAFLLEPGLLVWQIDEPVVQARWPGNTVNADPNRMGVRIRTASGRRNLETVGSFDARGSRGDPWPGCIKGSLADYLDPTVPCEEAQAFHARSASASVGPGGAPLGVTLVDISRSGPAPFDVVFGVSTRWTRLFLEAREGGAPLQAGAFSVDGELHPEGAGPVRAAPFQRLQVEAPAGGELTEGIRVGFQAWEDGDSTRVRMVDAGFVDSTLVARFSGREARILWSPEVVGGNGEGLPPAGALLATPAAPDLWVPLDTEILFQAQATTGFRFLEWTGVLAGSANPTPLLVTGPLEIGARFELTYGFENPSPSVSLLAADPVEVVFEVTDPNLPLTWLLVEGVLPEGLTLDGASGRIEGASLEAGTFQVTLRARDALGLEADARVTLQIAPPDFTEVELTGPWLGTGPGPQGVRRAFLDWSGNRNGFYDLGDLRRHILAHGPPRPGGGASSASGAPAPAPGGAVGAPEDGSTPRIHHVELGRMGGRETP